MTFSSSPAMWSALTILVLLGALTVGSSEVQDRLPGPLQNPYANDPCGDPRNESDFWSPVSGRALVVVDGDTFTMSHNGKRRQVQLVGIEAPTLDQPFGRDAQALLERLVKDKTVEVWISPSDARGKKFRQNDILGVVYLREQNMLDVNLELINAGLARHKSPPPYKMSNYTACQYHKAEEQAQTAKRGLWSGSSQ